MNPYRDIDGVLKKWAKSTGSVLYKEWAGSPSRYFHIHGDPPFECFQVVVRAPDNGLVVVNAWAIDTNDDTDHELERTWQGSVDALDDMMASALETIESWKRRQRKRPDPPSPW